ncbi:rRNA methyltransferase [Caulobacter sp. SLTY]|uniref:transcription antitermination factor NusB n=1 Tax=Caulobacter sp. SLTY TaxID=2683262 RepID=UPI001411C400|nr:rRNA methyltransferase [Caulobacter sp. SLTY]
MTDVSPADDLAARRAALTLLEAALERRGGIDEAAGAGALQRLDARDRAFARALTLATLRRLGSIDRLLSPKLTREPPARVRSLLRLGVAQLFWFDTPDHAAVSTSVELADREKATRPFKGLVNAVLRGLLRDGAPADDPETLAPPWLLARWQAAWGPEAARAIAAEIAAEPATDLTVRENGDIEILAAELEAQALPGGTLRVAQRGDPSLWPGFSEGRWWVQDAAAAIPARLLHANAEQTAVDLCAAPGGKTLQLAAAGAATVAVDRSAERLKRVSENLARMSLTAEVVAADAGAWADTRTFDAVLLDAPCSATGTFRRHPDVLWAARPGDIAKLAAVQTRLLDSAAARVAPGGRLVYCVCSLEPEEGEDQVRAFLARNPGFVTEPCAPGEGGAPETSLTPEGWLRLLPHQREGGQDGFFIARLARA